MGDTKRPRCECGVLKVGLYLGGTSGRIAHHPNIRVAWFCKNCFKADFDLEKSEVESHRDWRESRMPKGRPRKKADPEFPRRIESQAVLTGAMVDPPSNDPIGVTPDQGKPGEDQVPQEPDRYVCGNCKAEVEEGAAECPVCELGLVWNPS